MNTEPINEPSSFSQNESSSSTGILEESSSSNTEVTGDNPPSESSSIEQRPTMHTLYYDIDNTEILKVTVKFSPNYLTKNYIEYCATSSSKYDIALITNYLDYTFFSVSSSSEKLMETSELSIETSSKKTIIKFYNDNLFNYNNKLYKAQKRIPTLQNGLRTDYFTDYSTLYFSSNGQTSPLSENLDGIYFEDITTPVNNLVDLTKDATLIIGNTLIIVEDYTHFYIEDRYYEIKSEKDFSSVFAATFLAPPQVIPVYLDSKLVVQILITSSEYYTLDEILTAINYKFDTTDYNLLDKNGHAVTQIDNETLEEIYLVHK